ncbi:hypothetical protein [Halegenticoccus soli]|uniref:hypothetical protein n=1 Tax=Halegenticoccus soli TaxID=1985678 RepID=UPI000C6DEBFC|nr:hypothetical protein [Halegenticoccus soli]
MRYYLDTNCLTGYTFFQDWWHSDAKRLFESDNELYIGDTVLFEYCNRPVTDDYVEYKWDRSELSWNEDKGNFKSKMAELRDSRFLFEDAIFDRDDLDLNTAVELFVDAYHIKPSSEPAIRRYFEEKLDQLDLDVTVENVRKIQKLLVEDLQDYAWERKDELRRRVNLGPERGEIPDARVSTLERTLSDDMDIEVVCDASYMCDTGLLERMVTGDKGNALRDGDGKVVRYENGRPVSGKVGIYNSREVINNVTGLRVLYLKDEFA